MEKYYVVPWEYGCQNELYHHGIKGQKWGIRRYQKKDGSLTLAGKRRYRTDKDFKKKIDRERGLEKARQAKEANKSIEERRQELLKSVDPKEIYENKHLLTTAELNDRINRIDTEARLQGKIPTEPAKPTGIAKLNSKMEGAKNTIDKAANLAKSIDGAYSTVTGSSMGKALAKKLGLESENKPFDAEDFLKNINKKSVQEIADASKRLTNEVNIRKQLEALKGDKGDKTAEYQKQVDDYNEKLRREAEMDSGNYRMKGDGTTKSSPTSIPEVKSDNGGSASNSSNNSGGNSKTNSNNKTKSESSNSSSNVEYPLAVSPSSSVSTLRSGSGKQTADAGKAWVETASGEVLTSTTWKEEE